jgi:hypothetical protein
MSIVVRRSTLNKATDVAKYIANLIREIIPDELNTLLAQRNLALKRTEYSAEAFEGLALMEHS